MCPTFIINVMLAAVFDPSCYGEVVMYHLAQVFIRGGGAENAGLENDRLKNGLILF